METAGTRVWAQDHRADRLPTAVPAFGTQGPGERVPWVLSSPPGNGLEGSHTLSVWKPSETLGALPPASLPRWVPVILDGAEDLPEDWSDPNILQGSSRLPSRSLPLTVHDALPRP